MAVPVVAVLVAAGATPALADVFWGPDSCVSGYVWREAMPTDHVCVPPATRDRTRLDNSLAPTRWFNGPFGPHTCIGGFVWREAVAWDDVCVTLDIRTQAAQDNANVWRYVAAADEYHCTWVSGLGSDTFCVKLDHDIFGSYNSIRTRYQHYGGAINAVRVGVLWNTNRGESGQFPSQIISGTNNWETHAWLQNATVGTCATARALISAPPNDPNATFGAQVSVCRTR
jgi:hypothetical protein